MSLHTSSSKWKVCIPSCVLVSNTVKCGCKYFWRGNHNFTKVVQFSHTSILPMPLHLVFKIEEFLMHLVDVNFLHTRIIPKGFWRTQSFFFHFPSFSKHFLHTRLLSFLKSRGVGTIPVGPFSVLIVSQFSILFTTYRTDKSLNGVILFFP